MLTGQQRKYCADPECKRLGQRAEWVFKTYGITLRQFDEILEFQDGKCGVCRKKFRDEETPHIDHEHGAHVRGLVHAYCNRRLIGRLKSAELAQGLADYLRDPPAVAALGVKVIAPGRPSEKKRRVYRRRK
ncbi:endonuclease domain-containing protein [Micromonospora salmantinae]|uniref:endonuclease domain-containing protein n=1 Tax=Micromonospora salmantinae TaxID=2911211 RepID=UPI0035580740